MSSNTSVSHVGQRFMEPFPPYNSGIVRASLGLCGGFEDRGDRAGGAHRRPVRLGDRSRSTRRWFAAIAIGYPARRKVIATLKPRPGAGKPLHYPVASPVAQTSARAHAAMHLEHATPSIREENIEGDVHRHRMDVATMGKIGHRLIGRPTR